MSDILSMLITILYGNELIRVALSIPRGQLPGDCADYPMEPENRQHIYSLLPLHVRNCGPIVEIDTNLFDVTIIPRQEVSESEKKPLRFAKDGVINFNTAGDDIGEGDNDEDPIFLACQGSPLISGWYFRDAYSTRHGPFSSFEETRELYVNYVKESVKKKVPDDNN